MCIDKSDDELLREINAEGIRDFRRQHHIAKADYCDILGLTVEELSRVENGKMEAPEQTLRRMITLYKIQRSTLNAAMPKNK